jgi:predicted PurR-regulated permease PerM
VSLAIALVLVVCGILLASSVLVPAFVETVAMARDRGEEFVEAVLSYKLMEPFRDSVHEFLNGALMRRLAALDLSGIYQEVLGGSVASFSTQVFSVVSTLMTGFFGLMFSLILLTDTSDVATRAMVVAAEYLGPERAERLALVLGVADASFHNFIVRQCIEAAILSTVATGVLILVGYGYALGVGVLMFLAALVPIVGYPVGLLSGAFMVAISNPWWALLFIVCVALAQLCEATLLLPHVGDPRTVLTPVWTTVGVTIGGGVAGFIGMLVAIPLAATIHQLIMIDVKMRVAAREKAEAASRAAAEAALTANTAEETESLGDAKG